MVAKNPDHGDFPVRVVKVQPQSYVAYRWAPATPGAELTDGNSTLVEFTLAAEGDKTRLTVVESGFAALKVSDEVRAQTIEQPDGRLARGPQQHEEARRRVDCVRPEPDGPVEEVGSVLVALADPTRRRLLDLLAAQGGATATTLGRATSRLPTGDRQAPRHPGSRRTRRRQPGRSRGEVLGAARRPGRHHAVDVLARGRLGPSAGGHQTSCRGSGTRHPLTAVSTAPGKRGPMAPARTSRGPREYRHHRAGPVHRAAATDPARVAGRRVHALGRLLHLQRGIARRLAPVLTWAHGGPALDHVRVRVAGGWLHLALRPVGGPVRPAPAVPGRHGHCWPRRQCWVASRPAPRCC